MKRTTTAAAAAILALAAASGALAQPGHDRGGPPGHEYGGPPGHSEYGPPGHAYGHDKWRKGQRLGRAEWRRYPAVDWRHHRLHRPPPGYEWREVDGQFVLAAAASGLIAEIIAMSR